MGNITIPEKLICKIRHVITKDLAALVSIDENSDDSWGTDEFKVFKKPAENILLVAEIDNHIVGFILFTLQKKRAKLEKLVITEILRRRSLGSQLIDKIKRDFLKQERVGIFVEVGERNLPIQLFLRNREFIATEIHPSGSGDSTYIMEYFK